MKKESERLVLASLCGLDNYEYFATGLLRDFHSVGQFE
jgi:hypothetical protein